VIDNLRNRISRRTLLGRLTPVAGALLATGAGGCGGGARPTSIRFWNGFTGPDGRTMLRMVKQFNAENPDVSVVMQRMDWNTCYNKLFVAGLGGRAPDVCVIHTRVMERFVRAGFLRANDDLAGGDHGLEPLATTDLDANVWAGTEFDGRHYGLPLDVHAMGMYYNRTLLREAGLADASGNPRLPRNRSDFLGALREMTRPGDGRQADQWGFVFCNLEATLYTFMRQFGGEFFTPDYTRCILHNARNVEALQFCVDMVRRLRVAPPPENFDAWIGFRQGKVGITFEGIYMLADLQKQRDLDFGGAPVPIIGGQEAVFADSHNLCLRSDLAGAQLVGAWRFVKFLSDHSLDWATGGQIPVRQSLRAAPRFAEMQVQSAFARQVPYVTYFPRLPFIFEFMQEFLQGVERAMRGRMEPGPSLAAAEERINRVIAREQAANGGRPWV
jgi:multiple sugar transport system substrate-binding protein